MHRLKTPNATADTSVFNKVGRNQYFLLTDKSTCKVTECIGSIKRSPKWDFIILILTSDKKHMKKFQWKVKK